VSLRLRDRLGVALAKWSRWLLEVPRFADDPFEGGCVYCGIDCNGTGNEHAADCPSSTGIYPVRRSELWPYGPACCDRCSAVLWPGDTYSHIGLDDFEGIAVYEVACTGCALLAELEADRL
jgi:hypothetical protein